MSIRSNLRKAGIAALAAGVAFGLAVPTAANADPSSSGRTYQISGSDTIQDVANGITNGYTYAGTTHASFQGNLGSWDAFGSPDPITPKSGGASFGRPHGSGDGVAALSAAWNSGNNVFKQTVSGTTTNYSLQQGGTHELDLARSSAGPSTPVQAGGTTDKLTFVPFARDAVGVAYQSHVTTPGTNDASVTDLSTAALTFIYNAGATGTYSGSGYTITAGSGSTDPVYTDTATSKTRILQPVLPQSSSGTRKFFLAAISVSSIGSWVTQGVDENDATALASDGELVPFSAAQWISQKNGIAASTFGGTNGADVNLINLNGVNPVTGTTTLAPNASFYGAANALPTSSTPFARDTYIVVPTANYSGTAGTIAKGLGQKVYGSNYVVEDYGFLHLSYSAGLGEIHSDWTN